MDLHGVYVPLITPFGPDGSVALDDLERLAGEYLDAGATGLVALGTTGEPATLTSTEKRSVIELVARICSERNVDCIVGAGTNSTQVAGEMITDACSVDGVTGILSVVPYYTRPSEDGIVQHFGELAQRSPGPLVLYNIPYRTGRGLGARSLLQLANTSNIAGLKQAVGGVDADTLELLANKPDDFHVLCGDDPFIFPLVCLGGDGAIAASSHVCTESFVSMVDSARKGDVDGARALGEQLLPVCKSLFTEPSPGVLKGVLARQGRIRNASLRLPMTAASAGAVDAAMAAIQTVSMSK